ncbi:F0F1 ATP synthase subunit epsilon [Variovorax sp. dw_954]|uniref:F0F1 ATP synthase subunit epsilon n=1 Tax=Variovorax sp. dw_954 TaxID=2720078 RepID=UPI001BD2142E|nr:F0F1 ATP synthase subunit epsilon [Variovorax sp. dw_954]
MRLKVLLPFQVFADEDGVSRIVAESLGGSFGLLPHRLDCVAALVPGILIYETPAHGEVCLAVDEGILVKTGANVLVSVRRALRGAGLAQLREAVAQQFLQEDAQARSLRSAMAAVESGFLRRFARFENA